MTTGPTTKWVLCAGTIAEASFRERVEAAAEAGFGAISLFPEHYTNALSREGLTPAQMRSLLEEAQVEVDELDPLLDWYSRSGRPAAASSSEELLYRISDELGARSINVAPAFAPTEDRARLADDLGRLCERAAQKGLQVGLEFLPWTPVPNIQSAFDIVTACGQSDAGITLDAWHFFRSGGVVSDVTDEIASRVTSIQLDDAPRTPPPSSLRDSWEGVIALMGWARAGLQTLGARDFLRLTMGAAKSGPPAIVTETLTRRLVPGEGELPLAPLLAALRAGGCEAPIGVEVFSSRLRRQSALDTAKECMAACQGLGVT